METLQFQAYEVFKQGFGESGAGLVMKFIDYKMENNMEHFSKGLEIKFDLMATKLDLMATKEELFKENHLLRSDFTREINSVRTDLTAKINSAELRLSRNIYALGLLQFLAIIGSILAIYKFMQGK